MIISMLILLTWTGSGMKRQRPASDLNTSPLGMKRSSQVWNLRTFGWEMFVLFFYRLVRLKVWWWVDLTISCRTIRSMMFNPQMQTTSLNNSEHPGLIFLINVASAPSGFLFITTLRTDADWNKSVCHEMNEHNTVRNKSKRTKKQTSPLICCSIM